METEEYILKAINLSIIGSLIKETENAICKLPPVKGFNVIPDFSSSKLLNSYGYSYVVPFYLEKSEMSEEDLLVSDFEKLGFAEKDPYFLVIDFSSYTSADCVGVTVKIQGTLWPQDRDKLIIPQFGNDPNRMPHSEFYISEENGLVEIENFISQSFISIAEDN